MAIQRSGDGEYFSDFVIFNNTVTIRGITASDQTLPIRLQTTDCLRQIDAFLAAAGTRKDRVLTSTVYLANMSDKDGMNDAWREWIDAANRPTRATVQTPLATPNTLVEIVVTAAV